MVDIEERITAVREKIASACQRAGRDVSEVTLIAVAKGQSAEAVEQAVNAGIRDVGENYAQEMSAHLQNLPSIPPVRCHFIGRLQRNKLKKIVGCSLIHSVDSLPLALEIERLAAKEATIQPTLVQISLGGESTKAGIPPTEVEKLLCHLSGLEHLDCRGFMTMPPYFTDREKVRVYFRQLREIRDAMNLKQRYKHPIGDLSMGMSSDFEVAIEEGATLVRIGTAIFGARPSKR